MNKSYSLLDEPWLPVRLAGSEQAVSLGLLDIFRRSEDIVALADTSPPNLVAQYRLLLAITHRGLVSARQRWSDEDRADWFRGGLPIADIQAYLESQRDRFCLFHPEFPFLQVAALARDEETRERLKPWTQIDLASASGNTPIVFDHACDLSPVPSTPARVVSAMLAFLQFTPGGLVKVLRSADKAGPLANTAAVIPVAETLARSLCLALHPAPLPRAEPDLPAWERRPPSIAELKGDSTLATGPNDRYTRLSRAILLTREDNGGVRWLHFAAGLALVEDPNAPDPMASFRAGSNGLVRVSFTEGRAVWRDLPALLPNPNGDSQTAAVVQYAISLHLELNPFEAVHQPLLVAGLASDQAKLLRWRMEQIALPSTLLQQPEKAQFLRERVAAAEAVHGELRRLATSMLVEILPTPSSKDARERARAMVDAGPLAASFFAEAERALPGIVDLMSRDEFERADGDWRNALRRAAHQAWRQAVAGLGASPRALRADARYWLRLQGMLSRLAPVFESDPSTGSEASSSETHQTREAAT